MGTPAWIKSASTGREKKSHRLNCSAVQFSSPMLCLHNNLGNGWLHSGVRLVTQYADTINPLNYTFILLQTKYWYRILHSVQFIVSLIGQGTLPALRDWVSSASCPDPDISGVLVSHQQPRQKQH